MANHMTTAQRTSAFLRTLPKRLFQPGYRTRMYIEFRAGAPDPARIARLERMRQLTQRR